MTSSTSRLALLIVLFAALASCASVGDGGGEQGSEAATSDLPSTRPIGMATPWDATFPRDFEEREWGASSEEENVVAHNGVLLRGAPAWRFYPPREDDPPTLLLRGRNTSGSSDVSVHLLPEELGFDRRVMDEEYTRRAIRRVVGGQAPSNRNLRRVEGGEPGDIVFLGRNFRGQASFIVRALPTSRGLFIITAAGLTPRDQYPASAVAGSFQLVAADVSMRIPRGGPAFFSRWPESRWLTDTTSGSLYALEDGRFALLSDSPPELPTQPAQSGSIAYVVGGGSAEVPIRRSAGRGTATYILASLDEEGSSLLVIGNASDAIREDGQEALSGELEALLSRNIVAREVALEALR
ncbi:MAG: hypothetical protein ACLFP6_08935 [Spirochaetaceae bacterium]